MKSELRKNLEKGTYDPHMDEYAHKTSHAVEIKPKATYKHKKLYNSTTVL